MTQLIRIIPRFIQIRTPWKPLHICLMSSISGSSAASLPGAIAKEPWHEDYNPSLENQSFKDKDRTIGFAEYGSPTGIPAFLFHGSPGSRYDGIVYHDSAKKLGVRIICPDRPGHGLSTYMPDRRLIDYPSDISALAKHLNLGPYHVFGQSGGGPYAVVCAGLSPSEELLNTGVVAGMGPPETITLQKAGWYTVLALWMHTNIPRLLRRFAEWQYPIAFIQDDEKLQKIIKDTMWWLPAETRRELEAVATPGKAQTELRTHIQCMFAQGWDGPIHDAQIYASPWGFRLEDVTKKVILIYGGKDVRTPMAFGKWYKDHLQDAELVEFVDDGHISIGERSDEILAKLVGREDLLNTLKEEEEEAKKIRDHDDAEEVITKVSL